METYQVKKDISVIYIKASSFPEGVSEAWQKLHSLVPSAAGRKFYGLSQGDKNGGITYMAAVEASSEGEADKLGCKKLVVPAGNYIGETLINWKQNMHLIGKTFQKLIADPHIDPNGLCLEEYINDNDVKCMVKII